MIEHRQETIVTRLSSRRVRLVAPGLPFAEATPRQAGPGRTAHRSQLFTGTVRHSPPCRRVACCWLCVFLSLSSSRDHLLVLDALAGGTTGVQ